MQLSDLQTTWDKNTRVAKLEIIERSNERRLQAFELSKNKGKSKKKKSKGSSTKRKTKSRRAPSTAEGLLNLMEKMTAEEKENFKLMMGLEE